MKRNLNNRVKCYCFTYNNYTAETEAALKTWLKENTKYAVYGRETGESGTPHLQGYMSLIKQSTMTAVQKLLAPLNISLHLETARGTAEQNTTYCTKQDKDAWKHGEITSNRSNNRTNLAAVVERLREPGITMDDIAKEFPIEYIKYNGGIGKLHNVYEKEIIPEFRDITVWVYYGEGGTGKTAKAVNDCKLLGLSYYILSAPGRGSATYYENFNAEKVLILDDFYGWLSPHELYRVLDIYKYIINIKHGSGYATWVHVIFTSNLHPDKFYKPEIMEKLDQTAWTRRFHNIFKFEYANTEKSAVRIPMAEKLEKPLKRLPVSNLDNQTSIHDDKQDSGKTTDPGTEEDLEELSEHALILRNISKRGSGGRSPGDDVNSAEN